jgi:hypothetical protein
MFAMTKKLSQEILWETNYSFPCELIIKAHMNEFKHKEIEIPYKLRVGEVTLNKWKSGKAYLKCIFNYKFALNIDPKQL